MESNSAKPIVSLGFNFIEKPWKYSLVELDEESDEFRLAMAHYGKYKYVSKFSSEYTETTDAALFRMSPIQMLLLHNTSFVLKHCSAYSAQKICKVYNPLLEEAYKIKTEELKLRFGKEPQKATYFHSTNPSNVDSICRYGFDYRKTGSSRGHKHGKGISYTPIYGFCHHFGPRFSTKAIFYVETNIFGVAIGQPYMLFPPTGCDTTIRDDRKVYVKYEDFDVLPKYVLYT